MRLRSLLLLVFGLSWVISCTCGSIPPEKGESHFSAQIYTDKIECLGSINIKGVLVKVEGRIQDNQLKGASRACLIIIPDGVSIKDAAQELSELNQEPSEQGAGIGLAKSKGFAYYGSSIAASYFGGLTHTAYVSNLDIPQQYKAYLGATSQESAQWVVYSEKGVDIKFPLVGPAASQVVTMIDANAERDITIQPEEFIQFELKAQVTNKQAGFGGGFLLIKQGAEAMQPEKLLEKLLQENKALPQGKKLTKLEAQKGVFTYSELDPAFLGNPAGIDVDSKDHDREILLEKGATYKVYFYWLDSQHNYLVSTTDKSITIPKAEVELEIQELANENLIGNMTTAHIDDFKLRLKVNITKHVGTTDPHLGFLFARGGGVIDKDVAVQNIKQLSTGIGIKGWKQAMPADYVIYVDSQLGKGTTGELESNDVDATTAGLVLGQDYAVYGWVQDGGEVFVSDNKINLEVPKVEGEITYLAGRTNPLGARQTLIIDCIYSFKNPYAFDLGNPKFGYLFQEAGTADPNLASFQSILNRLRQIDQEMEEKREQGEAAEDPDLGSQTSVAGSLIFWRPRYHDVNYDPARKVFFQEHGLFNEHSSYKARLVLRDGNTLFYSSLSNDDMKTYQDYPEEEQKPIPVNDPDNNPTIKYYITYTATSASIKRIEIQGPRIKQERELDKNDGGDKALIEKVLKKHIQGFTDEGQKKEIEEFIDKMG